MSEQGRVLAHSEYVFVQGREIAAEPVTKIEGKAGAGEIAVKPLVVGDEMLFIEIHRKKGLIDAEHDHADHESICYLVSGRMRVVIAGAEFIAEPGATWIHAAGVPHYNETLEDSVQIEIKSPPRKTWG